MLNIEPIHPYDTYDLIAAGACPIERGNLKAWIHIPANPEAGYMTTHTIMEIDGKLYYETTGIPFKSTTFV